MKKLFTLILLLAFITPSLAATAIIRGATLRGVKFNPTSLTPISVISHTHVESNFTTPYTSSAIDTTGADLLIVVFSSYIFNAAPTVSDSKGNTWTSLTNYGQNGPAFVMGTIFYAKNPTVGAGHTFTGTTQFSSFGVIAFKGTNLTAPFDVEHGVNAATAPTTQPGSITPAAGNELIISTDFMDYIYTGGTPTVDSGFTSIESSVSNSSNFDQGFNFAYKVQTTATSENPTWTMGSGNLGLSSIQAFKHN